MCDYYNAQCLAGHVQVVPKGSELERKAKERERDGYLDAIGISQEECGECQYDAEVRDRENSLYLDW